MTKPEQNAIIAWRRFVESPVGEAGLLYLRSRAPVPSPDTSEKMVFAAGQVSGFVKVFTELELLLADEEEDKPEPLDETEK